MQWDEVFRHPDAEIAYQIFMNILTSLSDKSFPFVQSKNKYKSRISKPWITAAINKYSITKNKLYKKHIYGN